MELYTFSGTGNSLHVARELAARFPGAALIPIMCALQDEELKTHADTVGVVFPIHALTTPWPVRAFLERADFSSASYIFAVATRECFGRVFSEIDKLLAKGGKRLDAGFSFEMPQNYIPIFETYSPEECDRAEAAMLEGLDEVQKTVASRETHLPKDPAWLFPLSHVVIPLAARWFQKVRFPDMEKSFTADEGCSGCGTCESLCLSGKIKMENNKPVWGADVRCTYCFACLHYCPSEAIQIRGRKTAEKGRYHHPAISAADIAGQLNN